MKITLDDAKEFYLEINYEYVVGASLKSSSGRSDVPIHSISNSIAYSPWRGTINTITIKY